MQPIPMSLWLSEPEILLVRPNNINLAHSSVRPHFRDGRSVLVTAADLVTGAIRYRDLPVILVFCFSGTPWALSNRRFTAVILAGHCSVFWQKTARPVVLVHPSLEIIAAKLTAADGRQAVVSSRGTVPRALRRKWEESKFRLPPSYRHFA